MCRKVVITDTCLMGWGRVCEGRTVNGSFGPHLYSSHINYLEVLAVYLSLQHFLSFLDGHHVLVRTDNTTFVAYINRQGELRSLQLHMLAHRLIVWSSRHFLSLKATHVTGMLNHGTDLLSRRNPLCVEWRLPPGVSLIWERCGRPYADLFATREKHSIFCSFQWMDAIRSRSCPGVKGQQECGVAHHCRLSTNPV